MSKKKLIIVDISSFIFRAFYAIRPLNAPDGTPVNAVYGVLSMMLKLMSEHNPTHMFLARDTKDGSFRKEMYPLYKANRSEPPEELIPQFALIETLIEKLDFKALAAPRYEADDVIASAVVQWRNYFDEIYIASGDKDLMQFVDDKVKILDTMKDKIYGEAEVIEKMGVRPDQIVDYLSMVGDTSDNVPGMKGIGEKGAAKLLEQYGTLENCFKHKDELTNKRVKTAFEESEEAAFLSKKLITLVTDVDLHVKPEETKFHFYPSPKLFDYIDQLGFKTFKVKLAELARIEDTAAAVEQPSRKKLDKSEVRDEKTFLEFVSKLDLANELAMAIKVQIAEHDRNVQMIEEIAFSWNNHNYHLYFSVATDLLGEHQALDLTHLERLMNVLLNENKTIIGCDLKNFFYFCLCQKIRWKNKYFDLSQASFVIDPEKKHGLYEIGQNYLGENLSDDLCEQSQTMFQVKEVLEKKLKELKLETVFYNIDQPMIPLLARMEFEGISFDVAFYQKLEEEFSQTLSKIEKSIIDFTGEEVNLKSPKQVSFLLFEKLAMPVIKKTKTGASTDSDVLIELEALNINPIPTLILQYREIDKLLSTYVKALPKMISPTTTRIHTHFQQFNAATGRLSSDSPNLQNIPIRSENGRRLRQGFVARGKNLLLSADYSQVELRILAHYSEDPAMLHAFRNNIDIHTQTASEMFEKPISEVTKEDRSKAKAINFGLMYGQSSYGLSQNLHIDRGTAKDFITDYFLRFNRVKAFLDGLKEFAEKHGYAQTLFGRKRFLNDIKSTNRTIKSMAERVAINSPIQGTAADIIKLAMLKIDEEMQQKKLLSRLLLQVHDELIFEVVPSEVEMMKELVKRNMESAATLKVPLLVEVGVGVNWYELK